MELHFVRDGAGGRNRTDTLSPEPDFESGASTSSTTPAEESRTIFTRFPGQAAFPSSSCRFLALRLAGKAGGSNGS